MKTKKLKDLLRIIPISLVIIGSVAALFLIFYTPGIDASDETWEIQKKEQPSRIHSIPVILYHNIDGKGPYSVSSATLRKHFEIIREKNIQVISLKMLEEIIEKNEEWNVRSLVITFDDGYLSNYNKLLPLVKEFAYPVTIFVYADFIRSKSRRAMTWKKLRILEQYGVSIESHSISHADLTTSLTSRKLYEEVYLSKRLLELRLDKKITYFAFPYGRYTQSTINSTHWAGYNRVFSTDFGQNRVYHNNYCLRRHHIKNNYSMEQFLSIIN